MKKINIYIQIGFLLIMLGSANADTLSPHDTLNRFLNALKHGDIAELQNLISGSYYYDNREQIENNPNYSEFLQNYYRNSVLKIKGTLWDRGSVFFDVEVKTHGATTSFSRFRLDRNGNGSWVITEELPIR